MDIDRYVNDIKHEIINWRRELHTIPELDFDLFKTSQYIKNELDKMGIPYVTMAKVGVCAIINGYTDGPTIALRSDMDGLPIKEETGLSFASENGYMHACGHDAHMAMLLGAAKILSKNKDKLAGNVKLFFQPAEENEGGAKPMINEGCLDNPKVDAIFGLHVGEFFKEVGHGMVGVHHSTAMASVDKFIVKVIGKGGHGGSPQNCCDPIVATCEIISSLQRIVSREISPTNQAVISIGKITGGSCFNIIPETIEFEGCVRAIDLNDRVFIEDRIKQICTDVAHANRSEVEINYINRFPAVINNSNLVNKFICSAEKVVGKDNIVILDKPTMGSEDMAYYLQKIPGVFFFIGTQNKDKGIIYPNHHPKFSVDEDLLWMGCAIYVQTIMDMIG